LKNIQFKQAHIRFSKAFSLTDINWEIESHEVWGILGPNGAGKTALAAAISGEGEVISGELTGVPLRLEVVSLEAQAALIERERLRDDSDLTDEVHEGTPIREILAEVCKDQALQSRLVDALGISPLLGRGFRQLSTGEIQKVLLTRALSSKPDLLILDEPFEGLDAVTMPLVRQIIQQESVETSMVLVFNRFDEVTDFVTHIAYIENGHLVDTIETGDKMAMADLAQLLHLKLSDVEIPGADPGDSRPVLDKASPLVRIKKARVRYGDNTVFEDLDWCINPGEHWQLTGPNGSGKTCLLTLITGDLPQCYNNDILVFGYQRGQGESIWDIKQHIGYVSTELQWEYRVSINLLNVIISGFYDSIGLYNKSTDVQQKIAGQWLQLLGMEDRAGRPFNQLSYGDQRLLLIARAMVKHPHMLILDEPCLGLDDMNRRLVLALVEKIVDGSETTVLYVNHHAEDKIQGIENYLALTG
jgi:molybdate transport system ATP-binding protein